MPTTRPPCPRLTEKERFYRELFEDAEHRGISLAQLAVEKDLAVGTLSWWRSEIRRREALRRGVKVKGTNSRSEESIDFVPVEVATAPETPTESASRGEARDFEVLLPGGAVVRVPEDFAPDCLTRLVRAVNAAC